MSPSTGKYLVQPLLIPLRTVVEDRGDACGFSGDDIGGAVAHVPATVIGALAEILQCTVDLVGCGLSLRYLVAAHHGVDQPDPASAFHEADLVIHELAPAVGKHAELDATF